MRGSVPLVEVRAPAIQHGAQQTQRRDAPVAAGAHRGDGDLEPARDRQSRALINRLKVLAEQPVEQRLVVRVVIIAEPPEPVRAFGHVQRFPGPGMGFRRLVLGL